MRQLDDLLLSLFMQGFYGYGSLSGTCWFIGMEEGGRSSVEEISRRQEVWRQCGQLETDDCRKLFFSEGAACRRRVQNTRSAGTTVKNNTREVALPRTCQ